MEQPLVEVPDLGYLSSSYRDRVLNGLCPLYECEDHIPGPLSSALRHIWDRTKRLSESSTTFTRLAIQFCERLSAELQSKPEWPSKIDYSSVSQRVTNLQQQLQDVVKAGVTDCAWYKRLAHKLIDDSTDEDGISTLFAELSKELRPGAEWSKTVSPMCVPGYYGSKGQEVIKLTLEMVFPDCSPDWNLSAIAPFSPFSFRIFILAPIAAILLIQQDLGISVDAAMDVMEESRQHGSLIEDDTEEDPACRFNDVCNMLLEQVRKLKAESERQRQAEEDAESRRQGIEEQMLVKTKKGKKPMSKARKQEVMEESSANAWEPVTATTFATPKPPRKSTRARKVKATRK
ncbi:hypothetical protein K474DRAFT_1712628 [Panus rudis PR-1116 ss-1]|nr:hypothetical protein K474DRAFT_1712628 [Panus rudis PR-1116 ss-1]